MMDEKTLKEIQRNHFGSAQWFRHWCDESIIFSEGANALCENGAAWLVDAIASHEKHDEKIITLRGDGSTPFANLHFWYLTVDEEDSSGVLECREDSDLPVLVRQEIEFVEFPAGEHTIYVGNDGAGSLTKIFLPSEY